MPPEDVQSTHDLINGQESILGSRILHIASFFFGIFLTYKTPQCSISGMIFGDDQDQNTQEKPQF